jgi:hypothetical protein
MAIADALKGDGGPWHRDPAILTMLGSIVRGADICFEDERVARFVDAFARDPLQPGLDPMADTFYRFWESCLFHPGDMLCLEGLI